MDLKAEYHASERHDYEKKIKFADNDVHELVVITREVKQSLEGFAVRPDLNHNQHALAIVQLFKDSLANHLSLVALLYKDGDAYKAAVKALEARY